MNKVGVGVIGLGTVGSGVVQLLQGCKERFSEAEDIKMGLVSACDIRSEAFEQAGVPTSLRTENWKAVVNDPNVHIVCELIGGTETAYEIIERALKAGKHVVTANKALLAERGKELFSLAKEQGLFLRFEAAVAGGIPILLAVREGLCANNIQSVVGILNGTSNYILHAMANERLSFEEALVQAQKRGFAEADPTLDIGGFDAAHKLALLGSLAFRTWIPYEEIPKEGISTVGLEDITYAAELGYVIKPLAIGRLVNGKIEVRVHPTLVPKDDFLASVPREYNAVLVKGDAVGPTLYLGKGAGRYPTASSVVADCLNIARNVMYNCPAVADPIPQRKQFPVLPMAEVETRYYIRLSAKDIPGVIGQIGTILARHTISIASVVQKEPVPGADILHEGFVPLVILLHRTKEKFVQAALEEISKLSCVRDKPQLLRIEGRTE